MSSTEKRMTFKNWDCIVEISFYSNNRKAIQLIDADDRALIAVATVNIPEAFLEPNQVLIKSWSENEGMEDALMKAGIIGPALRKAASGYVHATVHELLI